MSLLQSICDQFFQNPISLFSLKESGVLACSLPSHRCCYSFQVLGDIFRILYFVSTNGTEFPSAQSAEIESVELTLPHAYWMMCI